MGMVWCPEAGEHYRHVHVVDCALRKLLCSHLLGTGKNKQEIEI